MTIRMFTSLEPLVINLMEIMLLWCKRRRPEYNTCKTIFKRWSLAKSLHQCLHNCLAATSLPCHRGVAQQVIYEKILIPKHGDFSYVDNGGGYAFLHDYLCQETTSTVGPSHRSSDLSRDLGRVARGDLYNPTCIIL